MLAAPIVRLVSLAEHQRSNNARVSRVRALLSASEGHVEGHLRPSLPLFFSCRGHSFAEGFPPCLARSDRIEQASPGHPEPSKDRGGVPGTPRNSRAHQVLWPAKSRAAWRKAELTNARKWILVEGRR
jgi:hypothetical protein